MLREVLPRLVEQGLATSEPQLGFRVVTVSLETLADLTEARVALEGLVTRMAVERGDVQWETDLVAAHHTLSRTRQDDGDGGVSADWLAAHEDFHQAVLRGAGNPFLFDATTQLRTVSEVYRCWTRDVTVSTHRDIAGEHRAIMESAVDRRADECANLVEQHIRQTTDLLVASRKLVTSSLM